MMQQTSREALAEIAPTLGERQQAVLDALRSKWVYRILSSDSQDASAMAYQAVFVDHAKRVALAFSAGAGSQSLVPPLERVLKRLGAGGESEIARY